MGRQRSNKSERLCFLEQFVSLIVLYFKFNATTNLSMLYVSEVVISVIPLAVVGPLVNQNSLKVHVSCM